MSKPKVGVKQFLQDESDNLVAAVRAAAGARLRPRQQAAAPRPKITLDSLPRGPNVPSAGDRTRVVAIGTSTGGRYNFINYTAAEGLGPGSVTWVYATGGKIYAATNTYGGDGSVSISTNLVILAPFCSML